MINKDWWFLNTEGETYRVNIAKIFILGSEMWQINILPWR
jgi:hypothetical protein